jgi:hypothetical protein
VELAIPHQVVVTLDDVPVADLESGELGLALIAGVGPAQTSWEDTGMAVSCHGTKLASGPEDIKLLLVIHDGMGSDRELLAKECQRLRGKILSLGGGIAVGEMEAELLKAQFSSAQICTSTAPRLRNFQIRWETSSGLGAVCNKGRWSGA